MNKKAKNKSNEELDGTQEQSIGNEQVELTEDQMEENNQNPDAESQTTEGEDAEANSTDLVQVERDKYLRLYSEFENFRRRTTKERLEWMQNASKDLMVELLPIVDDMERALEVDATGRRYKCI